MRSVLTPRMNGTVVMAMDVVKTVVIEILDKLRRPVFRCDLLEGGSYLMKGRNHLSLALAATLGTVGIACAADDQSSAVTSDQLTEVIVTATKQSTTVQTTP